MISQVNVDKLINSWCIYPVTQLEEVRSQLKLIMGATGDNNVGRLYGEISEESDCVHSVKAVYSVLGVFSIACLCLLLLLHLLLPKLRNLNGKILVSCASSTLLATLFLLIVYNYDSNSSKLGCTVLGYFGLFSNLSMFSWTSVTCFNMVWTFRMMEVSSFQTSSSRKFFFFSVFGWGFPIIFTIATSLCQFFNASEKSPFNPMIGEVSCFVDNSVPLRLLVFFHLPVLLLILLNIIGFVFCARQIHKTTSESRTSGTPFICCRISVPISKKAGTNMVIK